MTQKTRIVEQLGETALLRPALVARGLRANDRAKYYMSLLLACRERALNPDRTIQDLRAERHASGEEDETLDKAVEGSGRGTGGELVIPQADTIHQRLMTSVEQMCAPMRFGDSDTLFVAESYEDRVRAIREGLPVVSGDTVAPGYVETVTRADRHGPDSVHLVVMDLHRELNRIQAQLAEQSLDGALVYGVAEGDAALVKAFMRGVNATAPLKLDHPGLDTTATRIAEELVIQNDLGTTDAHVIVIHVMALEVSFIYTDVHRARLQFFRAMFDGRGIEWEGRATATGADYEVCVGRRSCGTLEELQDLLAFLGLRLVFLIDWNRARKRLARFVRKADAVTALRWAAERGYGHRAFLEAGGERLIYSALERTAAPQLRCGARLDEVLGPQAALVFLQGVLRITSEALLQRRSLRLVRDEVQAELLERLQDSEQGVLALAADHAALIVALAVALYDALLRMRGGAGEAYLASVSKRAKEWETKADDIVNAARDANRSAPAPDAVARLLPAADDVADGLEEGIFLIALLPRHGGAAQAVDTLEPLAQMAVSSAEEFVKCLEIARDIRRSGTREDVRQFLVAVDRVITLEHESDGAERHALEIMLTKADNFRALHLLAQIARGLEESVDALARCALMLKDGVISELLVQ